MYRIKNANTSRRLESAHNALVFAIAKLASEKL